MAELLKHVPMHLTVKLFLCLHHFIQPRLGRGDSSALLPIAWLQCSEGAPSLGRQSIGDAFVIIHLILPAF